MRYGIDVINFASYADPATLLELSGAAEAAGWDGLFLWDHLPHPPMGGPAATELGAFPVADPWTLLTAVACHTRRLVVGTNVTPLPRRRPHMVASQVATLDRVSGGRVVLGVGLGAVPAELDAYGEASDPRQRAEMLDEGLAVIAALWSGERVHHHGLHYHVGGVRWALRPLQSPRVPIWVGGTSAATRRRAARWDGWTLGSIDETGAIIHPPDRLAAEVAEIRARRPEGAPFDVSVTGYSEPANRDVVAAYEEAGATWWLESINGLRGSPAEMLARVAMGPPSA